MELPDYSIKQQTGQQASVVLTISESLPHFAGHFPNQPILPGVVQVDWAIYFAQQLGFGQATVKQLEVIKFQQLVMPPTTLYLSLERLASGKTKFSFTDEEKVFSSGRIVWGNP
ncbi:ApeI family dehydratase [Spartinivicinus ruber]|uniref:ApeI family dehydratase n=1 Tax=Spartinivicinus ruber TaxID=2683272 RepID=UPI0013D8CA16|nr:thioester dehydrase [Spartinivicinus ruber]